MHIVFIVGTYYPQNSAVCDCAAKVAHELAKSHAITVISEKTYAAQPDQEEWDGHKIIKCITKDTKTREVLNARVRAAKGVRRKLFQCALSLYKLSRALKTILSNTSIRNDLAKLYLEKLRSIEEDIDYIIPVSQPYESLVAAVEYKRSAGSDAKLLPYLFDQFADNDVLHRLQVNKVMKRNRHIALEQDLLKEAHAILAMHSLGAHFSKDLSLINNVHLLEHPLIVRPESHVRIYSSNTRISYIGGLYRNYVVPDYFLKLYERVNLDEAVLHFYIIGNCYSIISKYCSKLPARAINHGAVDKRIASQEMLKSDILINIAEKKGIQMSSKILEYISYGKPIIHFYTAENDVNLGVLRKYPLVLCLKQDFAILDHNARKFEDFCKIHRSAHMSFEEVEKLFWDATPKFTAEVIEKLMLY